MARMVALGVVAAAGLVACQFRPARLGGEGGDAPDASADLEDASLGAPDAPPDQPDAPPDAGLAPPGPGEVRSAPAGAGVVVDGLLTEPVWLTAEWYTVSEATSHYDEYADPYANLLSWEFASAWDAANLYLAISVTDDISSIDGTTLWNGDSVELYFDDGDRSGGYEPEDFYFVINPYDQVDTVSGATPVVSSATVRTGASYVMEIQIGLTGATAGDRLPFDIGVNDDDNRPNPGGGASNDDLLDAYMPWYWETAGGCGDDCCSGSTYATQHTEPFCDTTRLGTLVFLP